jgi:hypothetical protein
LNTKSGESKRGMSIFYIIVSHEYKFIYFPIPKSGCSSVKKMLSEIMGIPGDSNAKEHGAWYYHYRKFPFVLKGQISKEFVEYFKFSFVRNPYDRLVSCYVQWVKNGLNPSLDPYGVFYSGMPFKEFVKEVCKIPDSIAEGHFRSQYSYLIDRKGRFLPDFVGKIENFENDFLFVSNRANLPSVEIAHSNKTNHENYRRFYDEETVLWVKERYKNDICKFEYSF